MTMKNIDRKGIKTEDDLEELVVGYSIDGREIHGDRLSKWAFKLLFGAILLRQGYTPEKLKETRMEQAIAHAIKWFWGFGYNRYGIACRDDYEDHEPIVAELEESLKQEGEKKA